MFCYPKRKLVFVLLVVLVALLGVSLACGTPGSGDGNMGGGQSSGKSAQPGGGNTSGTGKSASGKGTGGSAPAGGSTKATLTLVNDLNDPVCYVLISPTSSDTWGTDWLGPNDVINVGEQRAFTLDAGNWDMMSQDCNGNTLSSQMGVYVSGNTVWTLSWSSGSSSSPPAAGDSTLTLVNNSGVDICWVYISPAASDTWGSDWLGSDIVGAGNQHTFYLDSGSWDMLARDCNGNELNTQSSVYVSGTMTWTISSTVPPSSGPGGAAGHAVVTVVNNTDTDICYVYFTGLSGSWGDDWLGDNVIPPGGRYDFHLRFQDAAPWDMLAQDCSGNEVDRQIGVHVDNNATLTWTISGSTSSSGDPDRVAVTFVNRTSEPVCYVLIGPPGSEWTGDALGDQVIEGWGSMTVYIVPGTWALQAQDCSGVVMKTTESFTVTEGAVWYIDP